MFNRVSVVYLIICTCALCRLSVLPSGDVFWALLVVLASSFSYPMFLAQWRPKIGFWKGLLQLSLILAVAIASGFVAYLLSYASWQHKRLGGEFRLFEAIGWTFDESLAFTICLEVAPAAVIVCLAYPIGYFMSKLIRRVGG